MLLSSFHPSSVCEVLHELKCKRLNILLTLLTVDIIRHVRQMNNVDFFL